MGVLHMVGESFDMIVISYYYLDISRDWSYLIEWVTVAHILFGIAQNYFLVDSPKRLYATEQFKSCYDSL